MDINDIKDLAAFLSTLALIFMAARKQPHEIKQIKSAAGSTDAVTAKTYQEIANMAAERALGLEQRILTLENEKNELSLKIEDMEHTIARKEEENEALRDWAERLVHQVQALGDKPVQLKIKKATLS